MFTGYVGIYKHITVEKITKNAWRDVVKAKQTELKSKNALKPLKPCITYSFQVYPMLKVKIKIP